MVPFQNNYVTPMMPIINSKVFIVDNHEDVVKAAVDLINSWDHFKVTSSKRKDQWGKEEARPHSQFIEFVYNKGLYSGVNFTLNITRNRSFDFLELWCDNNLSFGAYDVQGIRLSGTRFIDLGPRGIDINYDDYDSEYEYDREITRLEKEHPVVDEFKTIEHMLIFLDKYKDIIEDDLLQEY